MFDTDQLTRRRAIALGAGALAVGGFAWQSYDRGVRIGDLVLHNRDDRPHTLSVRLERGGSILHDGTHQLGVDDGTPRTKLVQTDWDVRLAPHTFTWQVDDGLTESFTYDGSGESEQCLSTELVVEETTDGDPPNVLLSSNPASKLEGQDCQGATKEATE
ncbi:hypothetical protein [Haloarchaeobius sp. HME9146]|uniref:hypothetical protein n=1 Tax=Haloarchaeobius sp. HME9146 TaxID=2978732 RepID=UPI0021BE2D16|nr:hypothetical protein [Haloarchaeobius sp. HME9146]MCT9097485.1 hypothetical protein [Haloarchaeobius sp. HME9146]